jgi:hypothetical protein
MCVNVVGIPLRALNSATADMAATGSLLEDDVTIRLAKGFPAIAGFAMLDVFLAAAASEGAQTAAQSIRSTRFEWHKLDDGTTERF